jgi:hypothetical protein
MSHPFQAYTIAPNQPLALNSSPGYALFTTTPLGFLLIFLPFLVVIVISIYRDCQDEQLDDIQIQREMLERIWKMGVRK